MAREPGSYRPRMGVRGIVRFHVGELRQFDITIRYSREDCEYDDEALKAAHGTFLGVRDRDHRGDIIAYLQNRIWLAPTA